ncbi:T9SS type A sorting domain-containing protein [candidate division WOR-3 bacterium]|nr:T9SS type A sorting domain-containing protein [candidate division WOR-3 bacterium]
MRSVFVAVAILLTSSFAFARILQQPIITSGSEDIWEIDAEYVLSKYGDAGHGSLHGNAIFEYQWNNRDKEFLFLTVDPARGRIRYTIAQGDERVLKDNWCGEYGEQGSGTGQFKYPRGICIFPKASDNRYLLVFVADEGNDRIVKLEYDTKTRKLEWISSISTGFLKAPKDVACQWLDESAGTAVLAAVNVGENRINFYKVSSTGGVSYLTSYGTNGSGEGNFNMPTSLTFHNTAYHNGYGYFDLFVSDCGNNRIVKIRCEIQSNGSSHEFYWRAEKEISPDVIFVSGVYGESSNTREAVVFVHEVNRKKITAYDWDFQDKLYEIDGYRSTYMSFFEGECALSEQWSLQSGLKYYWLDSGYKEAGAIPNQFVESSIQDVVLNYVLTGGGSVTIQVWRKGTVPPWLGYPNWLYYPVATLEGNDPQKAGRHYTIWDVGSQNYGPYVITFDVIDYYQGTRGMRREIPITILPSGYPSAFYSSFEPFEGSAVPWENSIETNNFADNLESEVVGAENGITPHTGTKMYKVTGVDTTYGSTSGVVEFTVFNPTDYTISEPTYLSYWVRAKEFPNKVAGKIFVDGSFNWTAGKRLRDWEDYGRILDRNSKPLNEQIVEIKDGWTHHVLTLTPATRQELGKLYITLKECWESDTGRFTVYFDDIQLTSIYPGGPLEWYPEQFATGDYDSTNRDCNFDMEFHAYDLNPDTLTSQYRWVYLEVYGNGDTSTAGSCCECQDEDTTWVHPEPGSGIRLEVPPEKATITSSTKFSWWQYDKAHALVVGALLEEPDKDTNWLYWAWNADNHWDEAGYVHMGDSGHARNYNEWEGPFIRNIVADYATEFQQPGLTSLKLRSLRVAHYCRSDWTDDKGGILGEPYLGDHTGPMIDSLPGDSFPDPPKVTFRGSSPVGTAKPSGGRIMVDPSGWSGTRVDTTIKVIPYTWNLGKMIRPKLCKLVLSRNAGQTFEHVIADSLSPGEEEPLDTIIIDDTLETVRYALRGEYEWYNEAPPTSAAQVKLIVTDSTDSTYETVSNLFQIHIPSALFWPLEGNANNVAVNPDNGEIHKVWTTWGDEDTSERYILYTHSTDGNIWDTLDSPGEGRRPTIVLDTSGNPVILYNKADEDDDLGISSSRAGGWSMSDLNPPSWNFNKVTANFEIDDYDTLHYAIFAEKDSFGLTFTAVFYAKKVSSDTTGIAATQIGFHLGDYDKDYGPSIALDVQNRPHIAYRMADDIYYAHYTGSSWIYDTFPSDTTCHPSISCVGGNVFILYRNPDKQLARKLGYLDGTLTSDRHLYASSGAILDPRLIGGDVVVFTDNADTSSRKVRFAQYDSEVNGFSYPVPISDNERNAYSPQGRVMPDSSLWIMWTEDRGTHNKIAYENFDPLYESPFCELDAGWAETPYTDYRDDTTTSGGVKLDVGTDSVGYSFTEFNPSLDHTLLLEFFFEDSTVETTNYIIVHDREIDTIEIEEGYVNQFYLGDTSGNSTISLDIYPGDSIPVGVARIVVYEGQSSGGLYSAGIVEKPIPLPLRFALYQNFPNPFGSSTTIRYALPRACEVNLSVFDVSGRRVRLLHKGKQEAGFHELQWQGNDDIGRKLSSGVYFMRFEAEGFEDSKKMVLIK